MPGSVVFSLLILFIASMILFAASCLFAFIRKRWLEARRKKSAITKTPGGFAYPDRSSET